MESFIYLRGLRHVDHSVFCVTNGQNGYVIQAFENKPMTMLGAATTIPNTTCNGSCSATTATAWTTFSNSGFGYALETISAPGATLGITTVGHYKAFGVGYFKEGKEDKNISFYRIVNDELATMRM